MLYGNEWYAKRRADMLEYLGAKCVVCGTTESLEFDHVDPATKEYNVSSKYSYAWDSLVKELDKCQLLCKEHHLDKTEAAQTETHNRWRYGSRYKCRCEICCADYKLYRKERYQRTGN